MIREPLVRYTQQLAIRSASPWWKRDLRRVPSGIRPSASGARECARLPRPSAPVVAGAEEAIVRMRIDYDPDEFYTATSSSLCSASRSSATPGSSLVHVLKNGESPVARKDLEEKYGRGKAVNERIAARIPRSWRPAADRRSASRRTIEPAPRWRAFTSAPPTNWDALLARVLPGETRP